MNKNVYFTGGARWVVRVIWPLTLCVFSSPFSLFWRATVVLHGKRIPPFRLGVIIYSVCTLLRWPATLSSRRSCGVKGGHCCILQNPYLPPGGYDSIKARIARICLRRSFRMQARQWPPWSIPRYRYPARNQIT